MAHCTKTADAEDKTAAPAGSAERDTLTLDYLVTIIGFGLCRAWIVFCLGVPLVAGARSSFSWLYLASGAVSALAVSLMARWGRAGRDEGFAHSVLIRLTPAALVASGIVIPAGLWMGSAPLTVFGLIAGGAGAGLLQVLWGERFARHPVPFVTLASAAAAIVTALVAGMSSDHTSFIGFAIIPLLSFGLLALEENRENATPSKSSADGSDVGDGESALSAGRRRAGESDSDANEDGQRGPNGFGVGKLMLSIMTFSLLCRLFDATPVRDDPFAFLGGSAIFALIAAGMAFLAIVAKFRDRFNATLTYRLSLPIMVAGFVAIALFFDTHAALSILLINVGYELFDILAWVLFADASRRRGENALRIFGLGVTFMFAGMALGTMLGNVLDTMVASGDVQITAVAMMATLSLVVTAFMVLPEGVVSQLSETMRTSRRERGGEENGAQGDETPPPPVADAGGGRLEQHCATVAHDFGLTPRESEVIVLLAYGRTLSIIARDLQIAKGTARTHIENIYRKLDVHKQQELIDLVETYE